MKKISTLCHNISYDNIPEFEEKSKVVDILNVLTFDFFNSKQKVKFIYKKKASLE